MLKLTKYLLRNVSIIVILMEEINNFDKISGIGIKALAKFCTYDKRKRLNYQQVIDALFC
jgi:hypothetical protein